MYKVLLNSERAFFPQRRRNLFRSDFIFLLKFSMLYEEGFPDQHTSTLQVPNYTDKSLKMASLSSSRVAKHNFPPNRNSLSKLLIQISVLLSSLWPFLTAAAPCFSPWNYTAIGWSWTRTHTHQQTWFEAGDSSQQSKEIGGGAGGLWSVSGSSFMFNIVHKLFSLPVCGGSGVSAGWIGLSEAEVRPALLIISRTKYSPMA